MKNKYFRKNKFWLLIPISFVSLGSITLVATACVKKNFYPNTFADDQIYITKNNEKTVKFRIIRNDEENKKYFKDDLKWNTFINKLKKTYINVETVIPKENAKQNIKQQDLCMRALPVQVLSNNKYVDIYVKIPVLLANTKMLVVGDDLLKSFYFDTDNLIMNAKHFQPIPIKML